MKRLIELSREWDLLLIDLNYLKIYGLKNTNINLKNLRL